VYNHIPKAQRLEKNFADQSKPCMFLCYVHKSTTIWQIWDFSSNGAIEYSNAIFREDQNAFKAIYVGNIVKDVEFCLNIEVELESEPEDALYTERDRTSTLQKILPKHYEQYLIRFRTYNRR
jgi:hypothetical protein